MKQCQANSQMTDKGRKSAKTKSWRSWSQFQISTLLLVTAIVGVAFGWWIDRQRYVSNNARLDSALKELTGREKSLNQQLAHEQDIRELIGLLDPSQEDHQLAIAVLVKLSWERLHNSPLISFTSFKRESLPAIFEKQMEIVVVHNYHMGIPGWEDSVVLLLERTTEDWGDDFVFDDLRLVDCLVRHTKHKLFGDHHSVSYVDRDGDKLREVVFDFRNDTRKWAEVFQPTANGFVQLEPASPQRLTR